MLRVIIFVLSLVLSLSCSAQSSANDQLQKGIEQTLAQAPQPLFVGIKIQSMQSGKILYAENEQHLFTPASNLKLFTATAALLYLGGDYKFNTQLLTDATNINQPILNGNIYLKFSGDPDLTISQLSDLIAKLQNNGIKTIKGNLYFDASTYAGKKYGHGWMWDELNMCYASPIVANMINRNCVHYSLKPSNKIGKLAKLIIPPYSELTPISNKVVTVNANQQNCPLDLTADKFNHFNLTGCIPVQTKPIDLEIAISNPNLYTQALLKKLLQEHHIQLTGKILPGVANVHLTVLADYQSKPLAILVHEMLKDSVNQIANSLLKTLGAHYYQQPGTWKNGVQALQAILTQQVKLNINNAVIVDGDGVSRYDLVTPNQISALLNYDYHNFKIASEFIAGLPISGKDGTLEKRMMSADILHQVRAKTGTMTGVSSLSGYIETKSHHILSFVILINNFSVPDQQVTELEDKICRLLADSNFE